MNVIREPMTVANVSADVVKTQFRAQLLQKKISDIK